MRTDPTRMPGLQTWRAGASLQVQAAHLHYLLFMVDRLSAHTIKLSDHVMRRDTTSETLHFVGQLKNASDITSVFRTLTEAVSKFGFQHFLVTGVPLPGQTLSSQVLLSGWPTEWYHRYNDNNYVSHDPVARLIVRSTKPFAWSSLDVRTNASKLSRQVMNEAREFGMADGFTVPIYGYNGYQACVTMSADRVVDLSSEEQNAIYLISLVAFSTAKALITGTPNDEDGDDDITLTEREREIIGWVSVGKTNWEVSKILALSEKTVEKYLASIASKVGAVNRAHTVAELLRRRVIH
ncbi:MAG: LuxR family transcriptional regulator [Pseudomonadota bacterium]